MADTDGTVCATWEEQMLPCLVKAGGEKVQGCEDATIGPERILLHDILVVDLRKADSAMSVLQMLSSVNNSQTDVADTHACKELSLCSMPLGLLTVSLMSMLAAYGTLVTAGSRFRMYAGCPDACR